MPSKSKPKAGSLGVYPRVRAKSITAKFNSFKDNTELKVLNFHGYKAGMLHVMGVNKHKGPPLKDQKIQIPATVVEFPPVTVFGVRFYDRRGKNLQVLSEFLFYDKADKELSRTIKSANRAKVKGDALKKVNDFFDANKDKIKDVRFVVHTNPKLTTFGKKKPEVIDLYLSGNNEAKFNFFKEKLGKNIEVDEVFKELSFLDARAVTIGKGFEGPVRRYGIKRRHHKSEKGVRRAGSIGPWNPSLVMWTVPRPGQMGFHTRTNYNLKILKVSKPEELVSNSGWEGYGVIKNKSLIIAGTVPGPVKRLIAFRDSVRKVKDIRFDIEGIDKIVF